MNFKIFSLLYGNFCSDNQLYFYHGYIIKIEFYTEILFSAKIAGHFIVATPSECNWNHILQYWKLLPSWNHENLRNSVITWLYFTKLSSLHRALLESTQLITLRWKPPWWIYLLIELVNKKLYHESHYKPDTTLAATE